MCRVFGSLNLTTVRLTGVGTSFKKHGDAESKGIKAHFNMDESGVLVLDRVRATSVPAAVLLSYGITSTSRSSNCNGINDFHLQVEAVFETIVEEKEEESTLTSTLFSQSKDCNTHTLCKDSGALNFVYI